MQVKNTYSHIIKLALPVAVAILIPQFNILTNTLFLSHYTPTKQLFSTQDYLAASGIAGIYYLTLVMISQGLAAGLLMLMSRKAGENKANELSSFFIHGLMATLGMAIFLAILSSVLAPRIFSHFLHDSHICEAATSFIHIRYYGLPFIAMVQMMNSYFLAVGDTKKIMYVSIFQTLINIILDYVFLFGKFGFSEMGLNGTALASVFSEIGGACLSWSFLRKHTIYQTITSHSLLPDNQILQIIFRKSLPLIVQYLLSIGAWLVFFIFIEHIGKAESAVSQLLRSVFGIVGVAAWALGSTANSMVSNLIGQNLKHEVIPLIIKIIKLSLSISLLFGISLFLFPREFLSLLTSETKIIDVGVSSLQIVIVATWMLSVSSVCFHAVIGLGNTKMNMYFELISIIFYLSYTYFVVEVLHLSLPYAWLAEFIYWGVLFTLSFFYLLRFQRKNVIVKVY